MIEVRGLQKRFGPLDVLAGVDLAVTPGRITALVGPNGCGKTTLVKIVLGLTHADAGRVTIDGRALDGDWRYRERIGYMPQLPRFPENLTGRDVLALIDDLRAPGGRRDRTLLDGLALEAQLDKPLRTLSVGNRQRINAALAFLYDPDVLILDEPTAGLDPTAAGLLKDHVRRARARGRTVIVTSHVMAELEELADDVAFLLDGRIRFRGTLDELRTHTGEARLERAVARLMDSEARGPKRERSAAGPGRGLAAWGAAAWSRVARVGGGA